MFRRPTLPAAFAALWIAGTACASLPMGGPDLRRVELPERGASLAVPEAWIVRKGDFFHLQARAALDEDGDATPPAPKASWEAIAGPGGVVQFDYRGLEKNKRDLENKRQYALGWYKAIALSYPKWSYAAQTADDPELAPEGAFRFEGRFEQNGIVYRKVGILRFKGDRVHALYYTAPDAVFEEYRELFEEMDESHAYFEIGESLSSDG